VTAFDSAVRQVVAGTAHWTPAAWSAPSPGMPTASRAAVCHALAQRLADLAADAESAPHRPVPRLGNDLALPDQLRVLAADLRAATPPAALLTAAEAAIAETRRALWP